MKKNKFIYFIILVLLVLIFSSCQKQESIQQVNTTTSKVTTMVTTITNTTTKVISSTIPAPSKEIVKKDQNIALLNKLDSEQVILIKAMNDNNFYSILSYYEKIDGIWTNIIKEIPSTIGKYGINKTKEGDLKSPTGIFSLGSAFGFAPKLNTKYPFLKLDNSYYWVDDIESVYYNQLVHYIDGNRKEFISGEQMATFDVYKYGIFINYNLERKRSLGSAIFMHIYRSKDSPTGGCIATDEENLKLIISRLDIQKNPLIVIGDTYDYVKYYNEDNIVQPNRLHDEFVYIKDVIPDILIDAKYYTGDNFLGRRVKGYKNNTAIIKYEVALALLDIQRELIKENLSLIIFDAYRPQKAVDDFINWANDSNDIKEKENYYPNVPKNKLIEYGYIGALSNHSKGNTVDLAIVDLKTGQLLDMGSHFDFFGEISHYATDKITKAQFNNRKLLREKMISKGFSPYDNEWWHFSYDYQKYSKTNRYNFDVKY